MAMMQPHPVAVGDAVRDGQTRSCRVDFREFHPHRCLPDTLAGRVQYPSQDTAIHLFDRSYAIACWVQHRDDSRPEPPAS